MHSLNREIQGNGPLLNYQAEVLRLVQRFEETLCLPDSVPNNQSDQDTLKNDHGSLHEELSTLFARSGAHIIKDAVGVVFSVRTQVHDGRKVRESKAAPSVGGSADGATAGARDSGRAGNEDGTGPPASEASTDLPAGGASEEKEQEVSEEWLGTKQALETAFAALRREEGPGQRLVRMWLLSLLAEVLLYIGKDQQAFRTGQMFMKVLEESIAEPPLPEAPFGVGSLEFFEGIAQVFQATGNELYLIRLVSLLLHSRQFGNDLSRGITAFARKWNRVLYS